MQTNNQPLELSYLPPFQLSDPPISWLSITNSLLCFKVPPNSQKLSNVKVISIKQLHKYKSKSLTYNLNCFQIKKEGSFGSESKIQSRRMILMIPLRNAVEKLNQKRIEKLERRHSCEGEQFGYTTFKQNVYNPTVVNMHKRINGQEFAISSFAQVLRTRQLTKKITQQMVRKISKQGSLIGIQQLYKEHDNMERPPSCKTPRVKKPVKIKSKKELEKEFLRSYPIKFWRPLIQVRKKYESLYSVNRNSQHLPILDINKEKRCLTEGMNQEIASGAQSSRTTIHERPYMKENKCLQRQIRNKTGQF